MRIDSSQIAATLRRALPKPGVGTPMAGECSDVTFPGRAPVFRRRAGFHRNCVVMKRAAVLNMKAVFFAVLLAFVVLSKAFSADVLQAFPPAEAGMVRHVISLPKQDDESILKVELIIGKTVIIDEANHYFFGGALETESISGWGFERYILHKLGPLAGTLMAVDPDAPKVERFLTLGGEERLLRYNSRLPIVVYVPVDVEVRYRVWRAESSPRFVRKLMLPDGQTAVVSEGEFEARSIGSYVVRTYAAQSESPHDDTTFFASGVIRNRDGMIENVFLADLGIDDQDSLVVAIRSVGSGGYLSADAYSVTKGSVILRGSVSQLPADVDLVSALKAAFEHPKGS
jgi:ecotin